MKKKSWIIILVMALAIYSCSSEQTLQQYYIANAENPNFISFDVPASLLNLEKVDMSETQKKAVSSLRKLNILAFQKKENNLADYEVEKATVKTVLKSSDYSELMKMNTEFGKATIQIKGDDDAIDEIIIYGDNVDKGFVIIRVLGDDMNPASFVQLIQAIEKSDYKGKGLEQLGSFFKG